VLANPAPGGGAMPAAGPLPAEPTVPCYSCNPQQNIPVSQYQQHMKDVHGQG